MVIHCLGCVLLGRTHRRPNTREQVLQQDPDEGLAVSAPEAEGYEFQSHGIIEMLEKLLDKFIAERTALEKEEMNTKHNFDMLIQAITYYEIL